MIPDSDFFRRPPPHHHDHDHLWHYRREYICNIALQLCEDMTGANGDLDEDQINDRLIEAIHESFDYQFKQSGMMPMSAAASLVISVWRHMDRLWSEETSLRVDTRKAVEKCLIELDRATRLA
jgi:hypothetical protein